MVAISNLCENLLKKSCNLLTNLILLNTNTKMGSLDRGVLTGFICRLCSEMHRVVLHIYGEEGIRLCISEKINRYLSINVSRSDPLPKTICNTCLERLENQHMLVKRIEAAANMLKGQRRARVVRGCYVSVCDKSDGPSEPTIPE